MRSITIVRTPMRYRPWRAGGRVSSEGTFRRGAFSLVEMVMVVAVISVVAAIAVPRFSGAIARRRLESASTRIVQDIALARQHARLISGDVKISFTKKQAMYSIDKLPDPNAPGSMYSVDLHDAPYHVTGWAAKFDVNEDVTFDMYGTPNKGGSILIRIGGESKTINIDVDTGKAKKSDDPPAVDVSSIGVFST